MVQLRSGTLKMNVELGRISALNIQERCVQYVKKALLHVLFGYDANKRDRQVFVRALRERGLRTDTSNVPSQTDTLKVLNAIPTYSCSLCANI